MSLFLLPLSGSVRLRMQNEHGPLVMPLLGAINWNVSRLSKWWDLTYGIRASLDLHLLQMESALSQGGSAPGRLIEGQGRIRWPVFHTPLFVWLTIYFNVFKDPKMATLPCVVRDGVCVFHYFHDFHGGLRNSGALQDNSYKVKIMFRISLAW